MGDCPLRGDANELRSTAHTLGAVGQGLDDVASTIENVSVATVSGGVWAGDAASAFVGMADAMKHDIVCGGPAFTDAASALLTYAGQLESAQAHWHQLEAQIQQVRAQLAGAEAAAESAAQDAAIAAATAAAAGQPAPSSAGVAATEAQVAELNAELRHLQQQQGALVQQTEEEGRAAAYLVDEAARMSPHYRHHHSSGWLGDIGHFFAQFGSGFEQATVGSLVAVGEMAVHPSRLLGLGRLAWTLTVESVYDPKASADAWLALAKGVGDWKDLSSGNVGRWLGTMTGNLAMILATDGAAGALRGGISAAGAREGLLAGAAGQLRTRLAEASAEGGSRNALQVVLDRLPQDTSLIRPVRVVDADHLNEFVQALGENGVAVTAPPSADSVAAGVALARERVSGAQAADLLANQPFRPEPSYRMYEGRASIPVRLEQPVYINPEAVHSATGFDSWMGRGSSGGSMVDSGTCTSFEKICDFSTRPTQLPVVDDFTMVWREGPSEPFLLTSNSHRVAAAILRGEPIGIRSLTMYPPGAP